jgi:hypothetical protein
MKHLIYYILLFEKQQSVNKSLVVNKWKSRKDEIASY